MCYFFRAAKLSFFTLSPVYFFCIICGQSISGQFVSDGSRASWLNQFRMGECLAVSPIYNLLLISSPSLFGLGRNLHFWSGHL